MTRKITAKGGPLHGKSYTVPDNMAQFPAEGGTYRVTAKQATWQPGKAAVGTGYVDVVARSTDQEAQGD